MTFDATCRKIVTFSQKAFLAGLLTWLGCASVAHAAKKVAFQVTENSTCQLVNTTLNANGRLKTTTGDEGSSTPIRVVGTLRYSDAPLSNTRSVRWYEQAKAEISVGGRSDVSELASSRKLMVVQQSANELIYYSPRGPVTRGDLELITTQCDPFVVRQMLHGNSVELNGAWKPENELIAELFGLDVIAKSSLECKLLSATDDLAQVQISGDAEGTALGAKSKLKVDGTITFDRKRNDISRIALTIGEQRDVGLFAPGFQMDAQIDTTISPAKAPKELQPSVLAKLQGEPTPAELAIDFASPTIGVAFTHGRPWRVTLHRRDLLVLRMVDGGSFVAQCNMTPAAKAGDDPKVDAAEFQAHAEQAVAQSDGQIDEISTATREDGLKILRIAASGKANGTPITWIYYMLTDPTGKRMALVFTYATAQAEKFQGSDQDLIGSVKLFDESRSAQRNPAGDAAR